MGRSILLHIGNFLVHFLDGRTPKRHEQILGSLGSLGHIGVGSIVGIGIEAEQIGLLLTQKQDIADVLGVIVLITVICSGSVGLIHLTAQVTAIGIGQNRKTCCCNSIKSPLALLALISSEFCSIINNGLGQTLELLFVVHKEHAVAQVVLDIVAELEIELTQFAVDFLEAVLLCSGQQGAVAHKLLVVLLGEALLDRIQSQFVGIVIYSLHLNKKAVIHVHAITLCSKLGHYSLGDFLHLRSVVTLAQCIQHTSYLAQNIATVVQSQDSVLEVGFGRVLDDGINLEVLLLDTGLNSWLIVSIGDFVKRRNAVLILILRHKRIVLG